MKQVSDSSSYVQTERAFTPPLLARMGFAEEPNPRNITQPSMTSFNQQSWEAVTEEVSAHPVGGLRFTSFRYFDTVATTLRAVMPNSHYDGNSDNAQHVLVAVSASSLSGRPCADNGINR